MCEIRKGVDHRERFQSGKASSSEDQRIKHSIYSSLESRKQSNYQNPRIAKEISESRKIKSPIY